MNLKPILQVILNGYVLDWDGIHGISHWARVLENGLHVAAETGADPEVVALFAVLHDSRRMDDGGDPDHGPRAAKFARRIRDQHIDLPDSAFRLLCLACEGHTHELTHPDVTIQTCWDADRLDMGRIGVEPHPSRLCTDYAKRRETIRWADGRARFQVVPELVLVEWGIDLTAG